MKTTASKVERAATVGSRLSPHPHPRNLLDLHNQDVEHLVNGLQLRNHYGLQNNLDHGKQPLRHDRDVDDMSLHTTGV